MKILLRCQPTVESIVGYITIAYCVKIVFAVQLCVSLCVLKKLNNSRIP